ncbi:hypothetical protein HNR26_004649 [Rhizobium rosettiformans]|uniref:Uncharacterized protein n=1 Tax=Rhizobium rosettiformans TaxID=1368430 RepID=A0A7W8MET8_9HYPH|nr:hypothetical protein [Rhizobium rosettiformans]MBB5278548.1 hypothetical protein [Rhizobium rosettiformans]
MTHQTEQAPKQAGISHLFSAAGYSAGGLTRLTRRPMAASRSPTPSRSRSIPM